MTIDGWSKQQAGEKGGLLASEHLKLNTRQPCGLPSGGRLASLLLNHRALRLCSFVAPCQSPARRQRIPFLFMKWLLKPYGLPFLMKFAFAVLAVTMLAGAVMSSAQDAAQPNVNLPPDTDASPVPSPKLPELSTLDEAFKTTPLGKEADEMRLRTEMRRLQNEVTRDPEVVSAKAAAEAAPTDLEKRDRLRYYYELNYGRMTAKASSADVKGAIAQSKKEHIALLSQPRVRPGSGESPAPTPKKKKKKEHGFHKSFS